MSINGDLQNGEEFIIIWKTYWKESVCDMQFFLPCIVGGSQHAVSQSSALEGCGMQQVEANFLEVTLDFLELTQHHTPLLLDVCLVQWATLHHLWQQLHGWEKHRGKIVAHNLEGINTNFVFRDSEDLCAP